MSERRSTKQKQLLDELLNKQKHFFTAESFHNDVKQKFPKIGIATTYRFLKEKVLMKSLHTYLCNRRTLYSREERNHCHFTCEVCGKIEHFTVSQIDFLASKVKGKICHFQIDVSGACNSCRKTS